MLQGLTAVKAEKVSRGEKIQPKQTESVKISNCSSGLTKHLQAASSYRASTWLKKENKQENTAVTDRTNTLVSRTTTLPRCGIVSAPAWGCCGEIMVKVNKTAASLCKPDPIIH